MPEAALNHNRRALLLGLGNDILSDDAVGLRVTSAVRSMLNGAGNITVMESAEMGLSLLDLVSGYNSLVLVDAIQTRRAAPGFVHEFDIADLPRLPQVSPHFLGIAEMLALGRELGLPVPDQVTILAIEVEDPFTVSTRLTPTIEARLPEIIGKVFTLCTGRRW